MCFKGWFVAHDGICNCKGLARQGASVGQLCVQTCTAMCAQVHASCERHKKHRSTQCLPCPWPAVPDVCRYACAACSLVDCRLHPIKHLLLHLNPTSLSSPIQSPPSCTSVSEYVCGVQCFVVATLASTTPAGPFVFRNYEHPIASSALAAKLGALPGSSSHEVWQAVRASSAAPYYLDDFKCGGHR